MAITSHIFAVFFVFSLFFLRAHQAPIRLRYDTSLIDRTFVTTLHKPESANCDWEKQTNFMNHMAKIFFALAFLASSNDVGVVCMHLMFIAGCILSSIWSWSMMCVADVFGWSFVCLLLNVMQLLRIMCIKKPVEFDDDLEEAFRRIFRPFRVSRRLFRKMVSPEFCTRTTLQCGEAYAVANITNCDRVSLLLSGAVDVSINEVHLHSVMPYEFIDSMEYEANPPGSTQSFKVSISADGGSRYITWQRSALESLFAKHLYLKTVIQTIATRNNLNFMIRMNRRVVTERGYHLDIRLHCALRQLLTLEDFNPPFAVLKSVGSYDKKVRNIFELDGETEWFNQQQNRWYKTVFFEDFAAESDDNDEGRRGSVTSEEVAEARRFLSGIPRTGSN